MKRKNLNPKVNKPSLKRNLNPNPKHSASQLTNIKRHLKSGRSITPLQALNDYGCFRLGARIWDLQKEPHNLQIRKKLVLLDNGKRVMKYSLVR